MPILVSENIQNNSLIYAINNTENRASSRAFIPDTLINSSIFKSVIDPFKASVKLFSDAINKASETRNTIGQQQLASDAFKASIRPAFVAVIRAGRDRIKSMDEMRADKLAEYKVDPMRSVAIASRLAAMKQSEAGKLALSDMEVAVSAHRNWIISGLPDALRQAVEDFILRENLAASFAPQCLLKPTAENPFATGYDTDAALTLAKQALQNWQAGRDEIDTLSVALRSVADFTTVATGLHSAQVFAELSEGA